MGLNNTKEKRIFRIEMEPNFQGSPTKFTYCYARDLEAAKASGELYCFMKKKKKFFNVVEIYPWEIVTEVDE